MSNMKNKIQEVIDYCAELYTKSGILSVIDHVNKQMDLNNPLYDDISYRHCTQCETGIPVLNNTCLVCGQELEPLMKPTPKSLSYGDELQTLKQVRELINDLDDNDLVLVEGCDDEGEVLDLFPMSIDVIDNVELKDGSIVREIRFCQRPNTKPDTRDKQPVVDAVIKEIRSDMFYGDETVLDELLKQLPIEILINSLPEEKIKPMYEILNKEIKISTGFKNKNNKEIIKGDTL